MEIAKIVILFCSLIYQTSGYATTVVHLPENQATSAVSYDFTNLQTKRSPRQHQVTKNIYPSSNYVKSTFPQNDGQPQLFNVGYSVRFENQLNQQHAQPTPKVRFVNSKLNQGDIITGTRKQNVQIDVPRDSDQGSSIINQKRVQKRKRIKSAPVTEDTINSFNSKEEFSDIYVSPTTQKYFEALGKLKDVDYQQELSDLYEKKYTWRNLSPNVKIIKSTEVPVKNIENRELVFDHAKALSKSEGFGFSDAIRNEYDQVNGKHVTQIDHTHQKNQQKATSPSNIDEFIKVEEKIRESSAIPSFDRDQTFHSYAQVQEEPADEEITEKTKPQKQTKYVQIIPASFFKSHESISLNTPKFPDQKITAPQAPKQVVVQYVKLPQTHFESVKKIPNKVKYVKPNRGNILYTRKIISNHDFPRKTRIKSELRRDFRVPADYDSFE